MPKPKYGPPSEDARGFPSEEQLREAVFEMMFHALDEYMALVQAGKIQIQIPPSIVAEKSNQLPYQGGKVHALESALLFCVSDPETGMQTIKCAYIAETDDQLDLTNEFTAQVQLLIHELMRRVVGQMISKLSDSIRVAERRKNILIGHYAQDLIPFLDREQRKRLVFPASKKPKND